MTQGRYKGSIIDLVTSHHNGVTCTFSHTLFRKVGQAKVVEVVVLLLVVVLVVVVVIVDDRTFLISGCS